MQADRSGSLFSQLLAAANRFGWLRECMADERGSMRVDQLLARCACLGGKLKRLPDSHVGVMLPSCNGAAIGFFALSSIGKVPVMLNFTAGEAAISSACQAAEVRVILTARAFVARVRLTPLVELLDAQDIRVVYLDELHYSWLATLRAVRQVWGWWLGQRPAIDADAPAVVLFSSGSEGHPKGVVLSHHNLLCNLAQVAERVSFGSDDRMINVLPMFHSFGLAIGLLLPLLNDVWVYQAPSPLAYKDIVKCVAEVKPTLLFAADTFLSAYGQKAKPEEFASLRWVFAGAEKLKDSTRSLWLDKFAIDIIEGYGVTETSPVLAINDPMDNQPGTVGRLLPGIEHQLAPVSGLEEGGRLHVKGPNVMLGYLRVEQPGVIEPVPEDWHDTGDVVRFDEQGRLMILGRAKRFAKIAGEMVSLTAVEYALAGLWPSTAHAIITMTDGKGREYLHWVTDCQEAALQGLATAFKAHGLSAVMLPKKLSILDELPKLGVGKVDYCQLKEQLEDQAC